MSTAFQLAETIAAHAASMIADGAVVGLGTGHEAAAFIAALGVRVQAGLRVRGVPTSQAAARLAADAGIPLTTLDDVPRLDVDVDGADEVDPQLNLIKGYGGALVREKIVAAAADRLVILVGPEKLVPKLGGRGRLPVEVVPFAVGPCRRALAARGLAADIRLQDRQPLLTDNHNWILDVHVEPIDDPAALEIALRSIPGVVGTGLFLQMAHTVLIHRGDTFEQRDRNPQSPIPNPL